jgi:3'-phosphoadenosine 5'-phosphosulfate (PAPS) 3'-phosphatase
MTLPWQQYLCKVCFCLMISSPHIFASLCPYCTVQPCSICTRTRLYVSRTRWCHECMRSEGQRIHDGATHRPQPRSEVPLASVPSSSSSAEAPFFAMHTRSATQSGKLHSKRWTLEGRVDVVSSCGGCRHQLAAAAAAAEVLVAAAGGALVSASTSALHFGQCFLHTNTSNCQPMLKSRFFVLCLLLLVSSD